MDIILNNSMQRYRVYFAAPLFSEAELEYNLKTAARLEDICEVFLPQRDGSLVTDLVASGLSREAAIHRVFEVDLEAIRDCDILVILLDGRTIDEGACFELGYAYSLGKVCLGLQTDTRRLLPFGNNPMIDSALAATFKDLDDLRSFLNKTSINVLKDGWKSQAATSISED